MLIVLQFFDGCPNWETTSRRLATLEEEGLEAEIRHQLVDNHDEACGVGFGGSPTVLIDGVDPFPPPASQPGLACRVYRTEGGLAGSPTLEQLRIVIGASQSRDAPP